MPERSLVHDPRVLHAASIERIRAAERALYDRDYVLAIFLAGLAVECILQAIVLLDRPEHHDARHDLTLWLARARTTLRDAVKAPDTRSDWSHLVAVWRNDLRYLSDGGMLGYLRQLELDRGIAGGADAILKVNARTVVRAAARVHAKGVTAWDRYTRKSSES